MTHWWISPDGTRIISAPAAQDTSYQVNGWQGPYPGKAAAQAAQGGGGSGTSGWFVVAQAGTPATATLAVVHATGSQYASIMQLVPMSLAWGPYATQAAAQARMAALRKTGVTNVQASPPRQSALAQIGDFLSRLTKANTWLRVGEVLISLVLLGVGVARITNAVPLATKIARTASKAALI